MVASFRTPAAKGALGGGYMVLAPPEAQYALGGADNHTSVRLNAKAV
jgi:hypothetical protein